MTADSSTRIPSILHHSLTSTLSERRDFCRLANVMVGDGDRVDGAAVCFKERTGFGSLSRASSVFDDDDGEIQIFLRQLDQLSYEAIFPDALQTSWSVTRSWWTAGWCAS